MLPLLGLCSLLLLLACAGEVKRTLLKPKQINTQMSQNEKYRTIKVHLRNGSVCLMHKWSFDAATHDIVGQGTLYDFNRNPAGIGPYRWPTDSIAGIEIDESWSRLTGGGVLGISLGLVGATLFIGILVAVSNMTLGL